MKNIYVQYGCGTEAPEGWINFDASPTLRIQKIALVGRILRPFLNCTFDDAVRYGDIVRGLPLANECADGVFCSHILEHISLEECHTAIKNTFRILKPGGMFRCILPDLEAYAKEYVNAVSEIHSEPMDPDKLKIKAEASIKFLKGTLLGLPNRNKSMLRLISDLFGNAVHRWMWDRYSLAKALSDHGFVDVESFRFNACDNKMFLRPERAYQFERSFGLQCRRP